MKMLHGFLKIAGAPWKDAWVRNDLESLQNAVGGNIECYTVRGDLVLIMDKESRLKGKPVSCHVGRNEMCGNVLLLGVAENGEDFADAPISHVEWLRLLVDLAAEADKYVGKHAARAKKV